MWIAPTGEIHVLAIELQYIFAENDREYDFSQLNISFSDSPHEALLC